MFKKIAPGFLNRLDTYLLTKYPIIWISKIHYVLWFGLLLYLISAAIGWLVPIDLTSRVDDGLWYVLLSVLAFILSWFWGYRYLIFNKEKNFGNLKFSDEYKNFFLVFICISVFAWFASPFVLSYNTKMANMFTDKEIIDDVNTLNEIEPFIPTNYYSYENTYDTLKKRTFFNVNKINVYSSYTPWRYLNDTLNHPSILSNYQLKLSYHPLADYNAVKAKVALHFSICHKYGINPNYSIDEMTANYIKAQKTGWMDIQDMNLGGDYYKEEIRTAFNNLFDAKFGTLFIWDKDFLWAMFYVIFSLSLLMVLFKSTYWQQFLIMAIVLALYPLVVFILTQILFRHTNAEIAFQWFVFLLFALSIVSLFITAKQEKVFKPFFNILNQLFFLLAIYMPMMIVYFLNRNTGLFNHYSAYNYSESVKTVFSNHGQEIAVYDYRYYLDQYLYSYWQEEYDLWFTICKIVPIILFFICLPLMKKIFVKQLALPRRA
ncbi:MAG: hypothetical protein ABIP51_21095 [Bacteroidia bacterium]